MPPKRPRARPADTAVRRAEAVAVFALAADGTLLQLDRERGLVPCLRQTVIAGSDQVTGVLGVLTINNGRIVIEPVPAPLAGPAAPEPEKKDPA